MAAENLYSLLIRCEGGDEAAKQIILSKYALKQVGEQSDKLKKQFESPFQHAGIYLFSRQLLNTIGLGQLAQHAFSAIDVGMTQLSGAFGIALSTLGPLLLAMGVGITVFELYEKHAKKSTKELESLASQQFETFKKTDELNRGLTDLQKTLGHLPADLNAVKQSVADLDAIQRQAVEHTKGEQLAAMQAQKASMDAQVQSAKEYLAQIRDAIAAGREQFGTMADQGRQAQKLALEINDLTTKSKALGDQEEVLKGDIKAIGQGFDGMTDQAKKLKEAHDKAAEAAKKQGEAEKKAAEEGYAAWEKFSNEGLRKIKEFDAADDGLAKKTEQLNDIAAESTRNAYQKRQAVAQKFYDDQKLEIDDIYQKEIAGADGNAEMVVQAEQRKTSAMAALDAAYAAKQREYVETAKQDAINAAHQVQAETNRAIAQSLVEMKSAADAGKAIMKDFAETAIQDLLRIMEQAVLTRVAVSSIFAGVGSGAGGVAGPDAAGAGIGNIA